MTDKLLTDAELVTLTGARNKASQKKVLSDNGIRFIVRIDGKVRTTWDAVNAVLVDKKTTHEAWPRLDFLRK